MCSCVVIRAVTTDWQTWALAAVKKCNCKCKLNVKHRECLRDHPSQRPDVGQLRRGENRSIRRKTSPSKVKNQQQTQPTYDAGPGNRLLPKLSSVFVFSRSSSHNKHPKYLGLKRIYPWTLRQSSFFSGHWVSHIIIWLPTVMCADISHTALRLKCNRLNPSHLVLSDNLSLSSKE